MTAEQERITVRTIGPGGGVLCWLRESNVQVKPERSDPLNVNVLSAHAQSSMCHGVPVLIGCIIYQFHSTTCTQQQQRLQGVLCIPEKAFKIQSNLLCF